MNDGSWTSGKLKRTEMIIFLCLPPAPERPELSPAMPSAWTPLKEEIPAPPVPVRSPMPSIRSCCILLISAQTSGSQASPHWPPKSHPHSSLHSLLWRWPWCTWCALMILGSRSVSPGGLQAQEDKVGHVFSMPGTWSKFNDCLFSFWGKEGGPHGMQDPSSQTRDWTCAPCSGSTES